MTQTQTTGRDLDDYALMDRYTRQTGRVLLTGTQALVRILLDQRDRDRADGINTRRVRLRLSRLAARRRRSGTLARQKTPERTAHRIPARRQRGPRRHRRVGIAAGRNQPGARSRWRVRPLVRQGPRRRPIRRCVEARQCLRLLAAWRRAGRCRRRSWLRVVVDAASVRRRLHGLVHADTQSVERGGISCLRRIWLRAEPFFRHVGRIQGDLGNRRVLRLGRIAAAPHLQCAGIRAAR